MQSWCDFQNINFPKNNDTNNTKKKQKYFFFIFGSDKDWPWSYVFSFKVRNQGYVVLEKIFEKKWEKDLIFF